MKRYIIFALLVSVPFTRIEAETIADREEIISNIILEKCIIHSFLYCLILPWKKAPIKIVKKALKPHLNKEIVIPANKDLSTIIKESLKKYLPPHSR